ncbi:MAG: hypothetical protein M9931_04170 [Chitinophagales bacterium]|nr:hypothetical protein [Chitinophagales bacterium]MCO5280239.1 hypothetical protein [Chitinophagales bacterium]OJV25247.1 MAG: hypothetical protein BGO32_04750 [Bacteroidetes bacterium 37-13]HRN93984.1 hypothetical protein [Chitinophagales bacterium]HRP39410.1 hypothetical protein [Chitinophagales bacterium]
MKHFFLQKCNLLAVAVLLVVVCSSFSATSPMALVMKNMLHYLQKEKKAIVSNKKKTQTPSDINEIFSAEITVGKKLASNHKELSIELLKHIEAYNNSAKEERKTQFNLVVKSCVACHEKVCPGPIEAIERNLID